MKNLATSKNDICLIAGSGLFVYEVANYLNNKNLLNQIVLINENNLIKKKFKDKCKSFKIKDIEKITTFIRSKNLKKIMIIGYVELPSIDKINLSIKSKLLISKDIFLNNINDQSKILKRYLSNNKLILLSQKKILKKMLVSYEDEFLHNINKKIINKLKLNKNIYLGDIVINLYKIDKRKIKFESEFNKLWVHGLVHLLGYKHYKNKDFFKMMKIENKIIKQLKC